MFLCIYIYIYREREREKPEGISEGELAEY